MKTFFIPALRLTLVFLVICSVLYPLLIAGVGKLSPNHGLSDRIISNGRTIGYTNVAQKFTLDRYFSTRPSSGNYNAMGSAGSNKGPSNPDYLKDLQAKINTFMKHNPKIPKNEIPAELVTYSGSGLDPDLSVQATLIQVPRIAAARGVPEEELRNLVRSHIQPPLLGFLGPEKVNVLKLNLALDQLKK